MPTKKTAVSAAEADTQLPQNGVRPVEEVNRRLDKITGRLDKLESKMQKIMEYRRKKQEEKEKKGKKEKKEKRERTDRQEEGQVKEEFKKEEGPIKEESPQKRKAEGEGEQRVKRKYVRKASLIPAEAPQSTAEEQTGAASIVPAASSSSPGAGVDLMANARGRPKKQPKPASKPALAPDSKSSSSNPAEPISDPRGNFRCYEVLNVPRTAKPDMIKKAFRVRALAWHPDKPTGNHKMFLALHDAFELMQDPTQRAMYDSELVRAGSRDGLSYDESDTMLASIKVVADPGVFCDAFLSYDEVKWPGLFAMLSNDHIVKLVRFLRKSYVPEVSEEQQTNPGNSASKMQTPGINRSGSNYFARILIENSFTVETAKIPDLSGAIDGRIALLRLRTRVAELKQQNCALDDAFRLAVQELRAAEQHAAFWLHISFKYQVQPSRWLQTPFIQDIDVVLCDKNTATELIRSGASPEEIQKAHESMKLRERALRVQWREIREFRLKRMLEAAEHHANVRSAIQADMLAIGQEPENDEKCDENDEKPDASDNEDDQTLSSLAKSSGVENQKNSEAKAKHKGKKKQGKVEAKKKEASSSNSSSSDSDSSSSS